MKKYYIIKDGLKNHIKKIISNREIANKVGITEGYISQILNARKKNISKTMAYAIAKAISKDSEINDIFNIIEEER